MNPTREQLIDALSADLRPVEKHAGRGLGQKPRHISHGRIPSRLLPDIEAK